MSGINKTPILSVCIPTWNRSRFLNESLSRLYVQSLEVDPEDIEFFISDNASDDDTETVVSDFVQKGMSISYNKNPQNLGAARNFIRCIQWSQGKYIWLLGDDDFLKSGALKLIIDTLKQNDCGLLHLYSLGDKKENPSLISDSSVFLCKMSFWSTFMSGNIFNRSSVSKIVNPEQYIDTHLLQVPFFLESVLSHQNNIYIGIDLVLETGADDANNGGYNFFEVFTKHYLDIWNSALVRHDVSRDIYDIIRKDLFENYLVYFIDKLLLRKESVSNVKEEAYSRKGWRVDNSWSILNKYYFGQPYFYLTVSKMYLKHIVKKNLRKT